MDLKTVKIVIPAFVIFTGILIFMHLSMNRFQESTANLQQEEYFETRKFLKIRKDTLAQLIQNWGLEALEEQHTNDSSWFTVVYDMTKPSFVDDFLGEEKNLPITILENDVQDTLVKAKNNSLLIKRRADTVYVPIRILTEYMESNTSAGG